MVISIILICLFLLTLLLHIRNLSVYKFRTKILNEDHELCNEIINHGGDFTGFVRYDKLPSYDRMVIEIWKWPLSSYLKEIEKT